MADETGISWADSTFNPWIGCTKVSPGCDHCYAERDFAQRKGRVVWGAGQARSRTKTWASPKRWNDEHEAFFAQHGRRRRVFCASLADVFDNEVDPAWRAELFVLIAATPHLDWLLLTKRIGNVAKMIEAPGMQKCGLPSNVWLGATVVDQGEAERDIPKLLAVPARVRFLSIEPMLGPVYIEDIPDPAGGVCLKPLAGLRWVGDGQGRSEVRSLGGRIDWVICGGESGPEARPMHPNWVRSLRQQCAASGVPFLFKQWGEWTPGENVERQRGTVDTAFLYEDGWHIYPLNLTTDHGHIDDQPDLYRVGKKEAGHLLDGAEHHAWPAADNR